MHALLLSLLMAGAGVVDPVVGHWQIDAAPEVLGLVNKLGLPLPNVQLWLKPDGRFFYKRGAGSLARSIRGKYVLLETGVKFVPEGQTYDWPVTGVDALLDTKGELLLDGMSFKRTPATGSGSRPK